MCHASSILRPEHPRPDSQRPGPWLSLNGSWEFRFDPEDRGEAEHWERLDGPPFDRTILVPFPWEAHAAWGEDAAASNDNWFSRHVYRDPASVTRDNYREAPRQTIGWYRRRVRLPAHGPTERLFLHIGAADWHVKVWVNGRFVAEGESGYVPFSCDITEAAETAAEKAAKGPEATIVIRVYDPQGAEDQPLGKQHRWYTTTSGIWQPVWLEVRPARHIVSAHLTPHLQPPRVTCAIETNVPVAGLRCRAIVRDADGEIVADETAALGQERFEIPLSGEPRLWSPESPHLYDVTLQLLEGDMIVDELQTYFGLREIGVAPLYASGPTYITLNGRPLYLKGALDQSFNPWGVYAWRSDAEMIRDLELAKAAGFNFLRIHIKPEDPRFLYWADRLGMLIMYDFPNLGYNGYSPRGCQRWEWTMRELIMRDYNHPSIFAWVLFNETWGLGFKEYPESAERQAWVERMYHTAKALDPSRLVEDQSACHYDHIVTDINSWHFYINDYEQARAHIEKVVAETYPGSTFNYIGGRKQGAEPLLNSEYGGISATMGDLDVSWCFKFLTDLLRRQEKICGYVYTELQDIEWEHNGIYNYDRSLKAFGYEVKQLQGPVYLGWEEPPAQTLALPATFSLRFFINRVGYEEPLPPLRWRVTVWDSLGQEHILKEGEQPAPTGPEPILTGALPPQHFVPEDGRLAKIELWLGDLAYNFGYLELYPGPLPDMEQRPDGALLLRKRAGDVALSTAWHEAEVERGLVDGEIHLFGGIEAGHIDYLFTLPEDFVLEQTKQLTFLCEASSKRLGAPQTEAAGPGWPSELTISINSVPVQTITLPDQFADSRGALSHLHGFRGRYGQLIRVDVTGALLEQIRQANNRALLVRLEVPRAALHHHGLLIYSSRAGRYPCDVTLILR